MARPSVHRGGMPSQRQLRVGELVRHALADIFARGDLSDPALSGTVITVAEVRMSPDLKNATVFAIAMGRSGQEEVIAALQRNVRFLRGEVARRVKLKYMPALSFRLDTSFEASAKVDRLLRSPEVARDLDSAPDSDAN